MPIPNKHNYNPPFPFKNNHLNTIFPSLFRRIKEINYQRIRIDTPDDDFLDLDFSMVQSNSIAIIVHGLESNTNEAYMKGLVRSVNNSGIDAAALNLRGCSSEDNKKFYSYHSGKTEDIETVINFITEKYNYNKIYLAGFSLGGNLVFKYAGERQDKINPLIKGAAGISVPCDLKASAYNLLKKENFLYQGRFMRSLRKKVLKKLETFPEYAHLEKDIRKSKNFIDFDNLITGPVNGFKDAEDYWKQSSCKQYLTSISIPALLISALDDPFLSEKSFPFEEGQQNPNFNVEITKYGGHVGFINRWPLSRELWVEKRVVEFFTGI